MTVNEARQLIVSALNGCYEKGRMSDSSYQLGLIEGIVLGLRAAMEISEDTGKSLIEDFTKH